MTIEGNPEDIGDDIAEEIAEEIVEDIEDETPDIENDIDVVVVDIPEEPEPEPFAEVHVGDLNISGPPALVRDITKDYLKNHIDHNPHGEEHIPIETGEAVEVIEESTDTIGEAITPDIVEEQIQESIQDEIADAPPGPSSWLYRPLRGR